MIVIDSAFCSYDNRLMTMIFEKSNVLISKNYSFANIRQAEGMEHHTLFEWFVIIWFRVKNKASFKEGGWRYLMQENSLCS